MEPDIDAAQNLPLYQCTKQVNAARIEAILSESNTHTRVRTGYGTTSLRNPHSGLIEVGGYVVMYQDGYASYSPAEAFETGYVLVGATPRHITVAAIPSKVAGLITAMRQNEEELATVLMAELGAAALCALVRMGNHPSLPAVAWSAPAPANSAACSSMAEAAEIAAKAANEPDAPALQPAPATNTFQPAPGAQPIPRAPAPVSADETPPPQPADA